MNYLKDLRTFKSGAMLENSDLQKFIGVEKNLPSSLQSTWTIWHVCLTYGTSFPKFTEDHTLVSF